MKPCVLMLLFVVACGGSTPPQAKPQVAARPSVDECKVALDHVIEVALANVFDDDDDEELRTEVMARVRADSAGIAEERCHAEALPTQVACLGSVADVAAVQQCAGPVYQCAASDPPDQAACATAEEQWGWAVALLTNVVAL